MPMCLGKAKSSTEDWELSHSGSVPAELVWHEMGIEATDPNSVVTAIPSGKFQGTTSEPS